MPLSSRTSRKHQPQRRTGRLHLLLTGPRFLLSFNTAPSNTKALRHGCRKLRQPQRTTPAVNPMIHGAQPERTARFTNLQLNTEVLHCISPGKTSPITGNRRASVFFSGRMSSHGWLMGLARSVAPIFAGIAIARVRPVSIALVGPEDPWESPRPATTSHRSVPSRNLSHERFSRKAQPR